MSVYPYDLYEDQLSRSRRSSDRYLKESAIRGNRYRKQRPHPLRTLRRVVARRPVTN